MIEHFSTMSSTTVELLYQGRLIKANYFIYVNNLALKVNAENSQ